MSHNKDGGPAFPKPAFFQVRDEKALYTAGDNCGMSLRDWFAGMALQGFWANPTFAAAAASIGIDPDEMRHNFTISAYKQADAMLEEREKEENEWSRSAP